MNQFQRTYIIPILNTINPKKLLEIGVLKGRHTYSLLNWCQSKNCELTSVDPTPWTGNIPEEYKPGAKGFTYKRGRHSEKEYLFPRHIEKIFSEGLDNKWTCVKALSLDFLQECRNEFDVVFIDGDHNYYTVINELNYLHKIIPLQGIIFIHDVSNPDCAYKDYYYDYTQIPEDFRNGEKQGVVNAINDFLADHPEFEFQVLTESENGLGIVTRSKKTKNFNQIRP